MVALLQFSALTPRVLTRSWRSLVLVFFLFYFGFHAVSGERGIFAWLKESRKLEQLKAELADAQAARMAYEKKIHLLRSDSLDPDMLDERARAVLGYSAPGEVVVMTGSP